MHAVRSRAYAGESDLPDLAELTAQSDVLDQLDQPVSIEELQSMITNPITDPQRDVRIWKNDAGNMIGFAHMQLLANDNVLDGILWFRAHPDARDGDLADRIIDWGVERLREAKRERGAEGQLFSGARSDDDWRIEALRRRGFAPARYMLRMDRTLDDAIPPPQLPAEHTLRHMAGAAEVADWVEMFNQSFIDHWNHHPLTVERRLHIMSEPSYRPDLDLIAVAPDGAFTAFCACQLVPADQSDRGEPEGWLLVLGTRRGYRSIGLGSAMLLAALHRLQANGATIAKLIVDAENPTGAKRIYERVGFSVARMFTRLVRDV